MRRALLVVLALAALAGGYVGLAHLSGGRLPTFGLAVGGDAAEVRRLTGSFWEDIQFKDFDHAATYHEPDRQVRVDIPHIIQRIFLVKPEMMDIMGYEVTLAELDSTALRARSRTRIRVKMLANGNIEEKEVMLFWYRDHVRASWYLKLEDSLRNLEPTPGKKT